LPATATTPRNATAFSSIDCGSTLAIGVNESEKAMPQPIIIDLECVLPSDLACVTNRLEHTIDCAAVPRSCAAIPM
jgi:dihydroneopterin aldolase